MTATKGPWKLNEDGFGHYVTDEKHNIMHMDGSCALPLISTAPEAIDLLRRLAKQYDEVDPIFGARRAVWVEVEKLIARADEVIE